MRELDDDGLGDNKPNEQQFGDVVIPVPDKGVSDVVRTCTHEFDGKGKCYYCGVLKHDDDVTMRALRVVRDNLREAHKLLVSEDAPWLTSEVRLEIARKARELHALLMNWGV